VEEFLLSKEIEDGCSPKTIKAYAHDLSLFKKSIPSDINIGTITIRHIRAFLKTLYDRNYTKPGLARKIATLKSFFNFLELNEYITKNLIRLIEKKSSDNKLN
jgi:site-specific recombinase XerD